MKVPLKVSQIGEYFEAGFVHCRGVLSEQTVEELRQEWRRLWDEVDPDKDEEGVHWRNHSAKVRVPDRLDPVMSRSAIYNKIALETMVREGAAKILGGNVFVLKDKLITKAPKTAGYDVHQDMPYWEETGIGSEDILTAAIAIDATTRDNGATAFYKEFHRSWLPTDEVGLDTDPRALRHRSPDVIEMAPGDVVYFSYPDASLQRA